MLDATDVGYAVGEILQIDGARADTRKPWGPGVIVEVREDHAQPTLGRWYLLRSIEDADRPKAWFNWRMVRRAM